MKRFQSIGIIYNASLPAACDMASSLVERLGLKENGWNCAAESVDSMASSAASTDLIITVGGDGTILRAAKLATSHGIPILGINMGRLGFMTELEGKEALEKLPSYLEGTPWIEERSMLQVQVLSGGRPKEDESLYHALNDAVIGRGEVARLVTMEARVDGGHLTTYRADAVVIATATGSTGYNLSAGGPIVYPQADVMVITPVAPHLGLATGLVLPASATAELMVTSEEHAMLSVDGYVDLPLGRNDGIRVQASPHKARFVRIHPPSHFYHTLTRRLDFGGGRTTTAPPEG